MHKFMEEDSIAYENIFTANKFSHTSDTQRENTTAIFTSEKLDILDDLADKFKDLTINDATSYE